MSSSLDDVYRKFGEVAEAAQLVETELGTVLLFHRAVAEEVIQASEAGIEIEKDPTRATAILDKINKQTLGQLLRAIDFKSRNLDDMASLLIAALGARNRLCHSFYREHNFRRNSDEGRSVMLRDLEDMHATLLDAYKALMLLSGIDFDNISVGLPTGHLPI